MLAQRRLKPTQAAVAESVCERFEDPSRVTSQRLRPRSEVSLQSPVLGRAVWWPEHNPQVISEAAPAWPQGLCRAPVVPQPVTVRSQPAGPQCLPESGPGLA